MLKGLYCAATAFCLLSLPAGTLTPGPEVTAGLEGALAFRTSSPSHPEGRSRKAQGVVRNSRGRIQRDPKARAEFRKTNPCPSTGKTSGACPGYEIDHRKALACQGTDSASNMQWLTKDENRHKAAKCDR